MTIVSANLLIPLLVLLSLTSAYVTLSSDQITKIDTLESLDIRVDNLVAQNANITSGFIGNVSIAEIEALFARGAVYSSCREALDANSNEEAAYNIIFGDKKCRVRCRYDETYGYLTRILALTGGPYDYAPNFWSLGLRYGGPEMNVDFQDGYYTMPIAKTVLQINSLQFGAYTIASTTLPAAEITTPLFSMNDLSVYMAQSNNGYFYNPQYFLVGSYGASPVLPITNSEAANSKQLFLGTGTLNGDCLQRTSTSTYTVCPPQDTTTLISLWAAE